MRERPALDHLVAVPGRRPGAPPRDVAGTALLQAVLAASRPRPSRWTLLLFLGSACDACEPFWPAAADPAVLGLDGADELVTIVREPDDPDVVGSGARGSTTAPSPVVVSTTAWRAFGVHGPPFFALLDGSVVACEGVAWSCEQVADEVRRARTG